MANEFTNQAQRILALAEQEARRLNHDYVGTEHILLALVDEHVGFATDVLHSFGVDAHKVRVEIDRLVQPGVAAGASGALPLTPRAKQAVAFAREEAHSVDLKRVDAEHLLLGLMREPDGVARHVLVNLGLRPDQIRRQVFKFRLLQMKTVERAVRPVRASTPRKRKMREELLAHLSAIYDDELARIHDPASALDSAARRFGDPNALACDLDAALPFHERLSYYIERWVAWRAPESVTHYAWRMALFTLSMLTFVLGIVTAGIILRWGWIDSVQTLVRVFTAIILIIPPTQFILAILNIKLRDAMWGAFGSRKSWAVSLALALFLAAATSGAFYCLIGIAMWDVAIAAAAFDVCLWTGLIAAVAALWLARFNGPTEIRDSLWALLEINGDSSVESA